MLLFLPPYSPDLTPIEESFSIWKAYLQRFGLRIWAEEDPILAILESTSCIRHTVGLIMLDILYMTGSSSL